MNIDQQTIKKWLKAFLLDRRVRQVSPGTIRFYSQKLEPFSNWCATEDINDIEQLSPNHLRLFLVFLEENGNNAGGRHAYYRAIRSFLNFYENEEEPEDWKNPINKVAAPRRLERPLDPVSIEEVSGLVRVCDASTFYGCRDKAIFMVLLDTGVRLRLRVRLRRKLRTPPFLAFGGLSFTLVRSLFAANHRCTNK